jgi:hypothetical protein
MIRSRSSSKFKVKTPGNRVVIHTKKLVKKGLLNLHPKIKREMLKQRVRQ